MADSLGFPTKFLKTVFAGYVRKRGLDLEVRCIPRNPGMPVVRRFYGSLSQFEKGWEEILRLNQKEYAIYYSIVPRDRKSHEPALLTCLWVDVDVGPEKVSKDFRKTLRRVRKLKPKPTVVVKSGHGLHVYWRLRQPIRTETVAAKKLLRAMARAVGGDLQAAEPARLLRLPNTLNWKRRERVKHCRVLFLKRKRRYDLAAFEDQFLRTSSEPADEAEDSTDYFEFYSGYVEDLQMRGEDQAMGLCPFHPDHTPSWSLRVTDGVWHCFGCGRSGNALSFCLMRGIDESDAPRSAQQQEHNALAVENGGYVFWKRGRSGWRKRRIANFVIDWQLQNRITDRIRLEDRVFRGSLVMASGERVPLQISNDDLCSNQNFYQMLVREAGTHITASEHDAGNIRRASFLFSNPRELFTSMDFGFQDEKTFLAKGVVIHPDGIQPADEARVELAHVEHACHLDLAIPNPAAMGSLLNHIRDDLLGLHPHRVTYTLLAFLGTAPLMHFMEDATRYALWLIGQSGTGKSFIARLFQCFFGDFAAEGRPVSWASTPNSLQYMGYFFKDCIYLVDDYKPIMLGSPAEVVRFLQNYADNYARSRLTSEIRSRKDYFVRGSLLTTGEDMPASHASLIARSLIVNVPKRRLDTGRGSRCIAQAKHYREVTASYIQFLLQQPDLREKVNKVVRKRHEYFLEGIAREDNAVRIARNLALNWVGFYLFTKFLRAVKAPFKIDHMRKRHLEILARLRDRMLQLVGSENPGQIFLQVLAEAIGSGRAQIITKSSMLDFSRRTPIVGFDKDTRDRLVEILPRETMALVREQERRAGREFNWTPNAVTTQLVALGALVKRQGRKDAGTTVRFEGKTHRVWLIKESSLGLGKPPGGDDVVT